MNTSLALKENLLSRSFRGCSSSVPFLLSSVISAASRTLDSVYRKFPFRNPFFQKNLHNPVTHNLLPVSIEVNRLECAGRDAEQDREEDLRHVRQFKGGDRGSFDFLVKRHSRRIFNTILRMVQNESEAEDLTQDTFIQVYKSLDKFQEKSGFYTWAYRIAVNRTINHLKKKTRDQKLFDRGYHESGDSNRESIRREIADLTRIPEACVQQAELQRLVERAVGGLSEAYRVVFVLREIEGLPYAEIAELLTTTEQAVRVRLHRAKRDLQEILAPYLRGREH